ncbi:hypothetical protein N644_0809 [Lactiplantibacillus paraplantarum]|nr:hypothetical protein N644_0809 [Lactiplantibacillus paraplantarum]
MGEMSNSLHTRVLLRVELGVECASAKWAIFGKQNWRCGMNQTPG